MTIRHFTYPGAGNQRLGDDPRLYLVRLTCSVSSDHGYFE